MKNLLEVIRRLSVVITWLIGGLVGVGLIVEGWNDVHDPEMKFAGAGVLVATFIVHKVINWVLLKDEKKPTSVD